MAKQKGENRLTWQPEAQVRLATVVVPFNNGYVLVARNMREIEIRILHQAEIIFSAWIGTIVVTLFFITYTQLMFGNKKKK